MNQISNYWRGGSRSVVPCVGPHLHVLDDVVSTSLQSRPQLFKRGQYLVISVPTVIDDEIKVPTCLPNPPIQHCRVSLIASDCLHSAPMGLVVSDTVGIYLGFPDL